MSIEITEDSKSHQEKEQDKQRDLLEPCGKVCAEGARAFPYFQKGRKKSIKPKN